MTRFHVESTFHYSENIKNKDKCIYMNKEILRASDFDSFFQLHEKKSVCKIFWVANHLVTLHSVTLYFLDTWQKCLSISFLL